MTPTDSPQPPVIDAGQFSTNDWLPSLEDACLEWGCFQLINHGIEQHLLNSIVNQMQHFFALSGAEKRAVERTRSNAWGFYDRELTKNFRDWKEIFDLGPAAETGPMAGSAPQWPVGQDDFREVVEQAFLALEKVASNVLRGIGENLGMDEAYRERNFHQ